MKNHSVFYLHFLITFGFVTFNKVITMQYYMWLIGAIFLVLPETKIVTLKLHRKALALSLQYILGISMWIWLSLRLEQSG